MKKERKAKKKSKKKKSGPAALSDSESPSENDLWIRSVYSKPTRRRARPPAHPRSDYAALTRLQRCNGGTCLRSGILEKGIIVGENTAVGEGVGGCVPNVRNRKEIPKEYVNLRG